jgi:PAS domain S-box-containing protein
MNAASNPLFAGNGEMATLLRSFDWSRSPLGTIEHWSPSLRTALSICLNSHFPMVIWWGKDLVLLYNDAWRSILGTKHPQALGCPGQEIWMEIWDIIGTQLNSVLETGEATGSDDMLLLVDRYGYTEEAYFTYSYSPIFLETSEVGGAFTVVTETTRRVIGERRLRTLRELAASTVETKSVDKTCRLASTVLAHNAYDIPFALLYLVEQKGELARLVGTVGVEAGTSISPPQVDLTQESDASSSREADWWKLAQVRRTGEAAVIENLTSLFEEIPSRAWDEPTRSAIVLPLAQSGQKQQLVGLLVLGINPRQNFDDEYRGFFDLVASHVTTAISNAYAYEEEQKRAEAIASLQPIDDFSSSLPNAHPASPRVRILLADDNADMQDYLQRLLSQHYEVETVANGRTALAVACDHVPDIILTGGMMPGLDGFELLRELRADSRTSQIPIILLLTRAGEASRIEGLEAGADDYLVKPFSARELLDRISATLKLSHLRREAARREQELKAETEAVKEDLQNVLNGINDQFITLDRDWRYTYVNDRVAEILEVPKENLLGRNIWEAFPDTVGTLFYTEVQRAVAEQTIIQFEYFYPTLDRWFENRIYPSKTGVTIFVGDISERKRAEAALRKSEERFQAFMAHSPAAAWITDRSGKILYLSQTYFRFFQLPTQDVMGKTASDLYAQEVAQPLLDATRQVADTQKVMESITAVPRPDGTVGEFLVYRFPIPKEYEDSITEPLVGGVAIDITERQVALRERQRAEAALQESEARFRLLAANSTDIISCHSIDGQILYVSPASHLVLGYKPEELEGCPSAELVDLGDLADRAKMSSNPSNLPDIYTLTHQLRHKAGHFIWLETTVKAIRDPQTGEIVECQASSRDITERRRAEDRLRFLAEASDILASSLDYEATLVGMAQLAVPTIADWCVVDILTEDRSIHRLAVAHGDPTKRELVERLRPHTPDLAQLGGVAEILRSGKPRIAVEISPAQIQAVACNAEHLELLKSLEPKSGMCIPVIAREQVMGVITLVSSQPSRCYEAADLVLAEELACRVAIAVDNARLYQEARCSQQATEQAANRTARLQAVTAALSRSLTPTQVADVIVEQGMAALKASSALIALLTEDEGELEIIRTVGYKQDVIDKWRRFSMNMPTPLTDAIRAGEPIWEESVATRSVRYPHLVEMYAQYEFKAWISIPLMLEGRAVGGLSLAFAEERTFSQNDRAFILALAQQCAQALERARLYEAEQIAREAAESANRIKDEFLAVLSHELRSPLNPILGWTKLLRSKTFDAAATDRALETIERNAKLQTQLIEDLLDISRILRGKLHLNVSPIELTLIIEAALETVRLAAEAKSIQVKTRFDSDVGHVMGDSGRLQQIVWNLLSNAVKFTPVSGRVEIRLERVGAQAQIRVSDTGKGIEPEFLPYVFDTFRQADYTTTRTFGGLGLGLAIVRHLVELHGGTVHAASAGEDEGSTFVVRLPLAPIQPKLADSSELSSSVCNLSGVRILAVDDDADMRELLEFVLEQAGAIVTVVASAREALDVLEQTQPDLLVSDIGMPGMDGYMLVRQVRSLTRGQGGQIPAIALTAYAGEYDQQLALSAGFQKHLSKPIEPDHLLETIAALLRTSKYLEKE